jgi:hypothetical protein
MKSIPSFSATRLGALSLGLMLVLSFHGNASAQWKWKDDSGRVQYSDLPPPPNVAEDKILQRPHGAQRRVPTFLPEASSAPAAPANVPKADAELEAKRAKQKDEEAAQKKAAEEKVAAAKAENCVRAKRYVASLQDGQRIGRTNDKGEREILNDSQRAVELQRAQGVVANDCT